MRKAQYQTKQMNDILNYLKSLPNRHISVNDITNHFKDAGITIGVTTIYRHLERLVEQGSVAKYTIDGISGALFEYIEKSSEDSLMHYHCKCEKCGKIIHLDCDEIANLQKHIYEHHGFDVDALKTVFYGICSDCRD